MNARIFLKWARNFFLIVLALLIAPFIAWPVLNSFGYHVNATGWQVAKIAAKKHDVRICESIIFVLPETLGPSLAEQRALCIYEYAQLTKDPAACELLLPREYGLSCIGDIWGKLIGESNCHWYQENAVRCCEGASLTPKVTICDASSKWPLPQDIPSLVAGFPPPSKP